MSGGELDENDARANISKAKLLLLPEVLTLFYFLKYFLYIYFIEWM